MINDTTASASGEKCKDCDGLGFHVVEVLTASGVQEIGEPCTTCRVTAQQTERMQPGRDAPKIKTWQERTGNHNIRPGSVKHMIAEIADLRAALARAPLPAQADEQKGDDLNVIACLPEIHTALVQAYRAGALRNEGQGIDAGAYAEAERIMRAWNLPDAAPAQADEARDAARYRWLRDDCHDFEAMTSPWLYDELDEKIDASIAASLAGKDKQ